jgi:SusD family.
MNRLFITVSIFLLFICGGCKKILDTKPQDFLSPGTYFNKAEDATAALNAAWQMLTRKEMYGGTYQFRWLTTDDCFTALSAAFPANLGLDASNSQYTTRWNQMYQTIQYLNVVLANLPKVVMDETEKGVIRGEALFLRGFLYYELAKEWGAVPLRITPTESPNDVNIPGTPVAEIYAQVLKDLTEAETLVPTTASAMYGGAGYAARTTVQAMLARVCLSMTGYPLNDASKYQDAKDWAQKVVESHEHALNPDFTKVFINYAQGVIDKKESLWEIDFNYVPTYTAASGYIGYLDGIRQTNNAFGNSAGQYRVTRKLILSYGPYGDTKDLRRDWTCVPWFWKGNASTEDIEANKTYWGPTALYSRYFGKFRLYYCPETFTAAGQSPINWPMIRYSDVLLMLAEAENALNGPTPLAYNCINQVRERAWGKMLPGATDIEESHIPDGLSKEQFQEELQMERYRELAGEGLRKQDLIRWGIFISNVKGLLSDILDPTFPAEANRNATTSGQSYYSVLNLNKVSERDLLFPIPPAELQYNKMLKQNPGW